MNSLHLNTPLHCGVWRPRQPPWWPPWQPPWWPPPPPLLPPGFQSNHSNGNKESRCSPSRSSTLPAGDSHAEPALPSCCHLPFAASSASAPVFPLTHRGCSHQSHQSPAGQRAQDTARPRESRPRFSLMRGSETKVRANSLGTGDPRTREGEAGRGEGGGTAG